MKKQVITKFLAIALFMFSLAACSSSDDTEKVADGFEGTWKVVKAEGAFASLNEGTKYIFKGNELTIKLGIIKTEYTFEKTETLLTYKMKDSESIYSADYSFSGKQLILKPTGSDQTLYLEKE